MQRRTKSEKTRRGRHVHMPGSEKTLQEWAKKIHFLPRTPLKLTPFYSSTAWYADNENTETKKMYGLLTKLVRSRWLDIGQVSFCVFIDRDVEKKERGQYPDILTEQAWSIKDLLHGFRRKFSCGTQQVVPNRQDNSILTARVANHSEGFDSSCPLAELAIYMYNKQCSSMHGSLINEHNMV